MEKLKDSTVFNDELFHALVHPLRQSMIVSTDGQITVRPFGAIDDRIRLELMFSLHENLSETICTTLAGQNEKT
jgi:hypothetical protein